MSKLGVYWSVMHRRPQDYDFFKRQQPSVFKIMDGGQPDYAFAYANLPKSLVIARDWALSEQHDDMHRDPTGTGIRHAQEWHNHASRLGLDRSRTLILGINEPRVWDAGVPEALRQYTIALCDTASSLNLRVGAMQLSVGWPNNTGPDTPPDWSPWHGVEDAIRRGNHMLVTHEYWADSGPTELWGWWAGRTLKCPWQVPFVIGECGVDMYVKDASVQRHQRGWRGRISPERYAKELAEYTGLMSADPRFQGCCVFAADYADDDWYSFDIEPAYQAILATPIPVVTKPHETHIPVVGTGKPQSSAIMYINVPAGANLRALPTTQSAVLVTIPYGEQIRVVGVDQSGWLRAEYGTRNGYIAAQLVSATEPKPAPTPPPPTDTWQRSRAFTARWEGGFQDLDWDKGNWTGCEVGKGIKKGTNYGISACSYPNLDIRNLTRQQADDIYFRDYWQASGAASLPWPLCLIVFDTAINHGVGTAKAWLAESRGNVAHYLALRLRGYRKSDAWPQAGNAWVDRVIELGLEAAK